MGSKLRDGKMDQWKRDGICYFLRLFRLLATGYGESYTFWIPHVVQSLSE